MENRRRRNSSSPGSSKQRNNSLGVNSSNRSVYVGFSSSSSNDSVEVNGPIRNDPVEVNTPPNNNNINGFQNGISSMTMFKEICGVNDEIAEQLLRESGGNLEAAIHQFFYTNENSEILQNQNNENQEMRQRQFAVAAIHARANNQPIPNNQNQLVPQRAPMTWGQWIRALVIVSSRFFYSTIAELASFLYDLFYGRRNPPRGVDNINRRAIQQQQLQQNVIQDRMLMRAQQAEYNQALAIDRERAAERKRQEDLKREEARLAEEQQRKLEIRRQMLEAKREEIRKKIEENGTPDQQDQGVIRIRVCFPGGMKVEFRFYQQQSLERLFEAVFVHPNCPEHFSIVTTFPSVILDCAPDWYRREFEPEGHRIGQIKTFAEQGLNKSAVVVVRDEDD